MITFEEYQKQYREIEEDYLDTLAKRGIPFAKRCAERDVELRAELKQLGVHSYYDGASLCWGERSDACQACVKGQGSKTFLLSLMCHRNCYFCFNPNQKNFAVHSKEMNRWELELEELRSSKVPVTHIALTGGEPLLHRTESVNFFERVKEWFPKAHTRLYTSGDLLDEDLLKALQMAGLREIRFSVKLEDASELQEKVLRNLALSKSYISEVMVEMPAIPGTKEQMKTLLLYLEETGVFGINLLEFCFPMHRLEAFVERGFEIKNPPYDVLYHYGYAGGLPVEGSETLCLELLKFAAERKMKLNVHYCSLANKNRGQIYQTNVNYTKAHPLYEFSQEDFFLKTLKVFGEDKERAALLLKRSGERQYVKAPQGFLQCHPKWKRMLEQSGIRCAVSYNVVEVRDQGTVMRELAVK